MLESLDWALKLHLKKYSFMVSFKLRRLQKPCTLTISTLDRGVRRILAGGEPNLVREAQKKYSREARKKFRLLHPSKLILPLSKTHFCPSKINFLKISGGQCPPQNQLGGGGMAPFAPPPCGRPCLSEMRIFVSKDYFRRVNCRPRRRHFKSKS